jgi:PDZ domain-containing protein
VALRQLSVVSALRWTGKLPRSVVVADVGSTAVEAASSLASSLGAELRVAPAADVVAVAGELPDPLVCLPAPSGGHRRRPSWGPVAAAVLRHLGAPVLLLPPDGTGGGDSVLVHADGSAASKVATAVATAWAGRLGLDLWLLGVVTPGGSAGLRAVDVEVLASGHLAVLARQVARAGGQAQWDVLHGSSPASVLTDHARRSRAALVVLGVDGGAGGRPLAGVARLAEASPAPVLLVPDALTEPLPELALPAGPRPRAVPSSAVVVRVPELTPVGRRSGRGGGRRAALVAGVAAALVFASTQVAMPYYSIRPGAALDAPVRIEGAPDYPPDGRIAMTTASVRRASLAGVVRGWLDGEIDLVHVDGAPIGLGDRAERLNARLMATSKTTALGVALRRLGYGPVAVRADIDSGLVGGPSAGLAFTLALLDHLTPGNLTGGRTVAVTGTMASDGRVGPVGAVAQKTVAARRIGAEVMIVPRANYAEAVRHQGSMLVVPVDTLADALTALVQAGGEPF